MEPSNSLKSTEERIKDFILNYKAASVHKQAAFIMLRDYFASQPTFTLEQAVDVYRDGFLAVQSEDEYFKTKFNIDINQKVKGR